MGIKEEERKTRTICYGDQDQHNYMTYGEE